MGVSRDTHVGPVIFSREEPRRQLEEHGEVVTVRAHDRTVGWTWWRASRTGKKRGDVVIQRLYDWVDVLNLAEHVEESGFESVEDWQAAIHDLHGEGDLALYKVVAKR